LTAQELDQRRPLITERRTALARVRLWIEEHVGAMLRLCHGPMI
jgi:hypothetical protein